MFSVAPMKIIHIDLNGNVTYLDDMDREEGVTSVCDLPKTQIITPGLNESTTPKGNWKDSATGFIVANPAGTIDLASALADDRKARRWWDEYN